MNTFRSVLSFALFLLFATLAQAQQTRVTANIPFDFVVGERSYPAGEYFLNSTGPDGSVIQLLSAQQEVRRNVLSHQCASIIPSSNTKLLFRVIGDNYFLYQIWIEGNRSGREFPRSHVELLLARNQQPPTLVTVAANTAR
jgi:hypothetical protein